MRVWLLGHNPGLYNEDAQNYKFLIHHQQTTVSLHSSHDSNERSYELLRLTTLTPNFGIEAGSTQCRWVVVFFKENVLDPKWVMKRDWAMNVDLLTHNKPLLLISIPSPALEPDLLVSVLVSVRVALPNFPRFQGAVPELHSHSKISLVMVSDELRLRPLPDSFQFGGAMWGDLDRFWYNHHKNGKGLRFLSLRLPPRENSIWTGAETCHCSGRFPQ